MKAAIYNSYLDTLGGGERYTMAVVNALATYGYRVDVQWKNAGIKKKLEDRFGILLTSTNFVTDIKKGDGYDVCFWVSDGSIPLLHARKNYLHFQVPFKNVNGRTLINKMKLFRINKIICNSYFTKKYIDEEYGVKSMVIYPPVDIRKIKPKRKDNLILYIGRFSQLTQSKRQDVLIETFKKMCDSGLKDWKLVIAGGVEVGVDDYVKKLKNKATNFPIDILESPDFKLIIDLFGKAKIFWSASGFGVNETKNPEKVEHFGITVVEAMSAGAVPVIYSAGGHKEIIKSGTNGYLWTKKDELIRKADKLITDKDYFKSMSKKCIESAKMYSYERFEKEVALLL